MWRPGNGKRVTARTELKVGDRLQAEQGGDWWDAEIVELLPNGKVKVHYTGWDESWDEVVPRSRLRLGSPGSDETGEAGGGEGGYGAGPLTADPLMVAVNGIPVTAGTPLEKGQRLQAEQEGLWWAAEVMSLRPDGRVKIHYTGWASSWDEVVPRSRLRLESPGPKQVTLFLDGSPPVTGVLVESSGDFLVVLRSDDRVRVFVNKQRIVCFEVREEPVEPGASDDRS
jgi:hypothetical protein